jgi:hemimethylated DNA binding protein
MGVDKLEKQDKQPFYNVLVGDGSQRYAAQENLVWQSPYSHPTPPVHYSLQTAN